MTEDDDPLGPYNDFWAMPEQRRPQWPLYLTAFIMWAVISSPWMLLTWVLA